MKMNILAFVKCPCVTRESAHPELCRHVRHYMKHMQISILLILDRSDWLFHISKLLLRVYIVSSMQLTKSHRLGKKTGSEETKRDVSECVED